MGEKQMFYYYKSNNISKKLVEFRDFEDPDIECQIVNEAIKAAKPLTDEETAERDRMLKEEGFIGWKKHDFYVFISRYQEIEDWQRYIKNIEKGEERLRKKRDTR